MKTSGSALTVCAALLVPTGASAAKKKYHNSYAKLPTECVEAWKEPGGTTGYCLPPKLQEKVLVLEGEAIAKWWDEQDRRSGGDTPQ